MNKETIIELVDKCNELFEQECLYRENLRNQIKDLEELIEGSFARSYFQELYKEEYGDYKEYTQLLIKEQMSRHTR